MEIDDKLINEHIQDAAIQIKTQIKTIDKQEFVDCEVLLCETTVFENSFKFGAIILDSDEFPIRLGQKFDREFTEKGASPPFRSVFTNDRPLLDVLLPIKDMPEWMPRIMGLRLLIGNFGHVEIVSCKPKTETGKCILYFFASGPIEVVDPDSGLSEGYVVKNDN